MSTTKHTTLFEIVHTDLWGLSPAPSSSGYSYYIAFVDACSRYDWIYLVKHKNDALSAFKLFQSYVSTQFNAKIKEIQSNFRGGFRPFTKLLNKQGIIHVLTFLRTSHQNGVVERKRIHIIEMGLTMLVHTSTPISLW